MTLTCREFEIYMMIVEHAMDAREIAKVLDIDRSMATRHIANILQKMECSTALQLLTRYHQAEGNL